MTTKYKRLLFTNDEECRLIELVRQQPGLWDSKSKEYRNLELRKCRWQVISENLKKPVYECQRKWRFIRDYYIHKRKRVFTNSKGRRGKYFNLGFLNNTAVRKFIRQKSASRRTWSRTETKTLLVFVNNRKEEFTHVKKRNNVYDNLVEDLNSCGVSEIPFYAEEIQYKLKTLKYAYKSAIDSNNRTGAAPVIAPYMELMDEIYGYDNVPPESSESPAVLFCSVGIDRQELPENVNSKELFESLIDVSIPGTDCVTISPFQGLSTSASSHLNNKKKISVKERLLNRKLKFKKEMMELKETGKRERLRMKENAKEKRHAENKEWQQKILNVLTKRYQ